MTNLWIRAALPQREAMAWEHDPRDPQSYTPVHVKDAGYAGVVGDHEDDKEWAEETGQAKKDEGFDEDLWDESAPDPTSHEQRHFEEHDEYPDAYHERHDVAYDEAKDRRAIERAKSPYDHEDPELRHFRDQFQSHTQLWHDYGRSGRVNLRQPVYATQTHVAREHIDKYKANPNATGHHHTMYPQAARLSATTWAPSTRCSSPTRGGCTSSRATTGWPPRWSRATRTSTAGTSTWTSTRSSATATSARRTTSEPPVDPGDG